MLFYLLRNLVSFYCILSLSNTAHLFERFTVFDRLKIIGAINLSDQLYCYKTWCCYINDTIWQQAIARLTSLKPVTDENLFANSKCVRTAIFYEKVVNIFGANILIILSTLSLWDLIKCSNYFDNFSLLTVQTSKISIASIVSMTNALVW